ncbi:MAG TPA: MBL fold metallo-hydrolase [Ktedonobacterales bacterium]|nr:MBL fold metallo-hydrolase [Ktedonobacterales bacterium]
MDTITCGEHLTQLTRRTLLFPINCYLVREEDDLTLVDTGLAGSAPAILEAARTLRAPIRRIVLTHVHMDHAGSLDALHAALPEAEVIVSTREARLLARDFSLDANEPQVKVRGGFPVCATRPTRTVAPGERIGSLEVIAAPGHTPGQVAFLDIRNRNLIAGDAISTHFGIAVAGISKMLFPFVAMGTWDKPTALRTAQALRALDPARLAVGHGPVLEQPAAAMDAAITEATRRFGGRASRAA